MKYLIPLLFIVGTLQAGVVIKDESQVFIDRTSAGTVGDVMKNWPTRADEIKMAFVSYIEKMAESNPLRAKELIGVSKNINLEVPDSVQEKVDVAVQAYTDKALAEKEVALAEEKAAKEASKIK